MQKTDRKTYFGVIPDCLDTLSLSYRWFGSTWIEDDSTKRITGYWFGDSQNDVETLATKAGKLGNVTRAFDSDVKTMYSEIHKIQRQQDWDKRSRFPLRVTLQSPWKNASLGWYIIRSRSQYPNYVSAVRKARFFVWVEHVSVCENNEDLQRFIDKVNEAHGIRLTVLGR